MLGVLAEIDVANVAIQAKLNDQTLGRIRSNSGATITCTQINANFSRFTVTHPVDPNCVKAASESIQLAVGMCRRV